MDREKLKESLLAEIEMAPGEFVPPLTAIAYAIMDLSDAIRERPVTGPGDMPDLKEIGELIEKMT